MQRSGRLMVWLSAALLTTALAALTYQLALARRPSGRWTLTEQFSAHHVLIAHVETRHLDEARPIAQFIAEPRKQRYAEILVYFHRPGRPDTLPPRLVRWTPNGGYVETIY